MDVEGAEYDLLQDFIKKDAIKLIDFITIEFHSGISPFKSPDDAFISIINKHGIQFMQWNK